ncbi:hypothetical protein NE619_10310 [Anaerovorax odorimutans]|uniref:Stage 0 sporulation protein A homolog n=1 Tax=Anaerovorax odorimutans TaxID=109327 RepID=A0ABT1RPL9_9FIRM|nr:response regulator [Anaerovorax odorimutans]MCQ4637119.1 hypothetical protein [Anaerovorax odorimutans]
MKSIVVFSQRKRLALLIAKHIERIDPQIKVYEYTDPVDALSFVAEKEGSFGGIVVDVDSQACDDLRFMKILRGLNRSLSIIFVSKSGRFAVEAFEYEVSDYLTLPIKKERLEEAIEKLIEKNSRKNGNQVYIRTFGSFEVAVRGVTIPWKNSKTKELLAFLVDSRGDNVSSEKIQKTLWPEADAEKAASNYHTTLHNLRKKLGRCGLSHLLEGSRGSQRVNVDAFECDLYDFERSVEKSDTKSYQHAFDLYKGRYLENNAYHWSKFTMVRIDMQFEQVCRSI